MEVSHNELGTGWGLDYGGKAEARIKTQFDVYAVIPSFHKFELCTWYVPGTLLGQRGDGGER